MKNRLQTRTQLRRNRVPTVKLKSGDISVTGKSVKDCQILASVANEVRKSAPPSFKFGPISISAGTRKSLIETTLLAIGGFGLYKGISYVFKSLKQKNDDSKVDDDARKPRFLQAQRKEPKIVTLNEIGRTCESDAIPLMGDFFYSCDIAVLFSITNNGKTMMGLQIAKDSAEGSASLIVPNCPPPPKQHVLYYNFEMREEQLYKRYFGSDSHAAYPDNLEIYDCKSAITSVDGLLEDIAVRAESFTTDTTIFIDTIKDVCPTIYAKEANQVMSSLRTIIDNAKTINGVRITVVLLGQANKKKPWNPLELDDLSGSFNFAGFADSVFAIGNTNMGKKVRMLKMLKGRNDGIREHVILLRTETTPYLHMEYVKECDECDALPEPPSKRSNRHSVNQQTSHVSPKDIPEDLLKKICAFYQKGVKGRGAKQVVKKFGKETGLNHPMQVTRLMNKLEAQGWKSDG